MLKRFSFSYTKQYFYTNNPTSMEKNYINIGSINFSLHLVLSGHLSNAEEAMRQTNPAFGAQYRNSN
jgi:hypothetical protein